MLVSHSLVVRSTAVLLFVYAFFLSAELLAVSVNEPFQGGLITKPKNDQRQYHYFTLKNGLKVLLIEDPSVEKTAVSLDVYVGSGSDPKDRAGLAHFLEHMLFLGTEKYPDASGFQDFISGHGGRHNAFTSTRNTNYFFDVDSSVLEEGIDRFAQFFVAPLFSEQYVERERKAVHSEFRSKYSSEGRRQADALRETIVQGNPLSKFPTGNLETLDVDKPRPLYSDLKQFYNAHYSAQRMALVVISEKKNSDLKPLIVNAFKGIKNTPTVEPKKVSELIAIEKLPAELAIRPLAETRVVNFTFPLPDVHTYYQQKPLSYIGHFIGHEGRGSLLSALKVRNWATGLSTGVGYDWDGGDAFYVKVQLTKQGFENVSEIEALMFEYISLLSKKGISKSRFTELKNTGFMEFEYGDKIDPYREAMYYANQLHSTPLQDILSAPYLFLEYDETLIRNFLGRLSPKNLFRKLVAPEVVTDVVSQLYGTPYKFSPNISVQAKCITKQCLALKRTLGLPSKNPYIPRNFDLVGHQGVLEPEIIRSGNSFNVWFAQDTKFGLPMGYVKARYKFPAVGESLEGFVAAKIMVSILREQMNEKSYDASMGGLSYSLNTNTRGIDLEFSGYSDSLKHLVRDVSRTMKRFGKNERFRAELNSKYFSQIQRELMRRQENFSLQTTYHQLFAEVPAYLYQPYWSRDQVSHALSDMTLEKYSNIVNQLFTQAKIDILIYGNYSKREALGLQKPLVSIIAGNGRRYNGAKLNVSLVPGKATMLQPESKIQVIQKQVDHTDKALVSYFQAPDDSLEHEAKFRLLVQCIDSLFYHQLRTEQQLGYVVSTSFYPIRRVPALVNIVQSPEYDSNELLKRVESFYADAEPHVFKNFERDKAAVVNMLEEGFHNQAEQAEEWWTSILTDDHAFDERSKLTELVRAIRLEDMQALYRESFIDSPRRLYFVTPSDLFTKDKYRSLGNSQDFKESRPTYVYP